MSRPCRRVDAPIAIVGVGCRYPDADCPSALWQTVLTQRRAFRAIPDTRLTVADYAASGTDSLCTRQAALLENFTFDRSRFKTSARTFRSVDVAHWLALDVAAAALGDAGFSDGGGLPLDTTGVVVGNTLTGEQSRAHALRLRWPFVKRVAAAVLGARGFAGDELATLLDEIEETYKRPFPAPDEESLAGGLSNTIAGRITNQFDLRGGGYVVDAACASSLLAVSQACTALASAEWDVAIAGGVDVSLDPFELVGFSRLGALATEEMRIFDRQPTGFFPGEGAGFVVLMRYDDAVSSGRRIYALIRGWGVSTDGVGGITRPESRGQRLAIERAYSSANVDIGSVALFEAHGTGTAVGDTVELTTLRAVTGGRRGAATLAALGSLKANVGHTKAAAGVGGLLKAVLALHSQTIPPTTGCRHPHPLLRETGTTLRVVEQAERWPSDLELRAGISAFGFGGINVHLVAEGIASHRRGLLTQQVVHDSRGSFAEELFVVSAADNARLSATVEALGRRAGELSVAQLRDVAHRLSLERSDTRRAVILAATGAELASRAQRLARALADGADEPCIVINDEFAYGRATTTARVGLLFAGQGSHGVDPDSPWRRLFDFDGDLDATVAACTRRGHTAASIPTTDQQQKLLACCWLASLEILTKLGLDADLAIGHSVGEIGALHWAGAYSAAELREIVAHRGAVMTALSQQRGGMLSVPCSTQDTQHWIGDDALVIACENAADQTIVSGPREQLESFRQRLQRHGIRAVSLDVADAFHSPLMAAAQQALAPWLQARTYRPLRRPVFSTITGACLDVTAEIATLLTQQVCDPVRFAPAMAAALDTGVDLWLELGPGAVLCGLVRHDRHVPALPLDTFGESTAPLLRAIGATWVLGRIESVAWLYRASGARPIDLDLPDRLFTNPCESAPRFPDQRGRTQHHDEPPDVPAEVDDAVTTLLAPVSTGEGPLEVTRRLLATRLELEPTLIREEMRLLGDLHLNSITIGQLAIEAALALGVEPPRSPSEYAGATVAQFAAAIAELPALANGCVPETTRLPSGLGNWVRAFETVWQPTPRQPTARQAAAGAGQWELLGSIEPELQAELRTRLTDSGRSGFVWFVPSSADFPDVAPFLRAAQIFATLRAGDVVLIVDPQGWAGGFARSFHLETRGLRTCIVRHALLDRVSIDRVIAEIIDIDDFVEVGFDDHGIRVEPVLVEAPIRTPGALTIDPDSVVWVIGGARGIGAECGAALAERCGAHLVLSGRTTTEVDPTIEQQLERLRRRVRSVNFVTTNIVDETSVRRALDRIESEFGPIGAVLHAAGINEPTPGTALDAAHLQRTLEPKWYGMRNLTAAFMQRRVPLLATFGSVIARTGMPGEAHYALANEGLVRATERFAAQHPECRCLALEWSVWSGIGMGERLGALEALEHAGISPIGVDQGVSVFLDLVTGGELPVDLVVCGRLGEPRTVRFASRPLPFLRFIESPRLFQPGIELVVDAELSASSDPYFADHTLQNVGLLPAVLGLEALAQAAHALHGDRQRFSFEQVAFARPVTLQHGSSRALRLLALDRGDGTVDVALRSNETDFCIDHFRAIVRADTSSVASSSERHRISADASAEFLDSPAFDPEVELYGSALFQAGRFRRVKAYTTLSARRCRAEVAADGTSTWFARDFPSELLLGDPGARDAALHALQACIPHARVLPISVDRIETSRLAPDRSHWVHAIERERKDDEYLFDLVIVDQEGRLEESWSGLRLRRLEPIPPHPWAPALLAAYLERRVGELIPRADIEVRVECGQRGRWHGCHRADGRPERDDEFHVSVADAGDLRLLVSSTSTVGCDLESPQERSAEIWRGLLSHAGWQLAEQLQAHFALADHDARTVVWAVRESLRKAGLVGEPSLSAVTGSEDGWILLRSGRFHIPAFVTTLNAPPERVAIAIAVED